MSNIWSEIKKQAKSSPDNPWANLPVFEGEFDSAPTPVSYGPVMVDNEVPAGSVFFDIETGSVTDMWSTGPEFMRLFGHSIDGHPVQTYEGPEYLIHDMMSRDGWIVGHNIMNFDSLLLDKHHGVSILQLAKEERLRDTKLIAFLADPPYSRTKEGEIEKRYSLQSVGTKYLGEGKMLDVVTGGSVLKSLANQFGGFDKIPLDHPEYNEYLRRDVEVTRDLVKVLPINDYAIREHKIAAIAATISIQGFRVDVPLLEQRIREGEEKRLRILTELVEYGLPGPETTKSPQMTKLGKQAIDTAFREAGVTLSRTASGSPALGKDVLQEIVNTATDQRAVDLAEAVMGLNGIRCVPLNSEILTRSGWKTVDEVQISEETLGIGGDGLLHWTPITAINQYEKAPLVLLSNNHFGVVCTPNHRWVTDHRYNSSNWTKDNPGTYRRMREMREATNLGAYDRIVVSALANTEHSLPISCNEAEIIGWNCGGR